MRDAWAGALSWRSCQSPVAKSCSVLNHLNSFHGGMFKLNAKSDADLLLYALSHFECNSHTVHMLTQWRLPPPLTSTVKSSLSIQACAFQSTPLGCQFTLMLPANCSCYINNGWTFSGQTFIYHIYIYHKYIYIGMYTRNIIYNGTLFSHKRDWNLAICNSMDGRGRHYAK